ncbi:EamA family transporter [Cryobacterium sp. TMT1-19]|uniref:EamA family transporter n=1 Tax=Cryobacterium sandaracinum TaxID=1259247 RepID=A0ABY2JJ08_9MICO|nr:MULTISPECIES: EamA family transporter [Cryobacterium]TFB57376.1 EamA family transporter [Cryobacterium sp. Sr3]TFB64581.1 EamA family transporter [Cryobacterium sp. Hz7]TFC34986.1 EamA family transporter [Cryobacterium sp. TMT2-14]TFC51415.1 EamA family transporter [Cryobacterium sp. TMT2-17-1]TFD06838.1 EamA family transporter [Cryobacterium sandaracinum]
MTAERDRLTGAGAQVVTEVSINFGSSLAGLAIPLVGSPVVVAVRQLVMAATVLPFYRPKLAGLSWRRLWPALALGVVLAVMNLTFYEAVDLLGLGIAATIEFLGPFALALASSRRLLDFVYATAAAGGVFLLTWSDGALNLLGILFALTAAASWAAYILLTRKVAVTFPGLEGISVASVVSLTLLVPFALLTVDWPSLNWGVIGLLLAIGVLSSAFPYTLDTFILRRITPRLYAIITSFGPVIAALFGALVLGETFLVQQQIAILVVCVAAGAAIASQRETPKSELEIIAGAIP